MVSANRLELLQIADAVAREKLIERELVIEAMEDSMGKAARSKYGAEYDIRAFIDRKTGEISMTRAMEVVDEVENHFTEITVEEARIKNPEAQVGDFITDPLPPMDFGRIAAQTAKQVIVQQIRDAERERQYEEFKDRVGEIINGIVKRTEYGNVIVDLGRAEAIVRRDQLIPREAYRNGDRVRAYIRDVRSETRGPQIFLSRTAPEFMAKLFAQEVPEIYDGVIEVKAVCPRPGQSRAKIGVISYDNASIDPSAPASACGVAACRPSSTNSRARRSTSFPGTTTPRPSSSTRCSPPRSPRSSWTRTHSASRSWSRTSSLSQAIGRRGQNVRLASQLTGWDIDIMTEAEESERRQAEFRERTNMFMETMNVDEMVAQLLVSEGFTSLEEVAFVELDELW